MHVHLSSFGHSTDLLTTSMWVPLLAPYLLSKKYGKFTFRTDIFKCRGRLYIPSIHDISSKGCATTINDVIPEGTMEYRLNENPLPLWIYLIPILHQIDTTFYNDAMVIMDKNKESILEEVIYDKESRKLCKKALTKVLTLEKEVLAYWKGRVKNYSLFKKVINHYFSTKLNSEKTLKLIKGL